MNNYRKFFYLLLVPLPLLLRQDPLLAEQPTVKIGMILPLSGNTSLYGEDAKRAVKIIESKINHSTARFRYEFQLEDGKCGQGNSAITAVKKLIDLDKIKYLVVGCSGEILQVAPIAEKAKVVTVCYACSHPAVKEQGDFIFRTYVDVEQGVQSLVEALRKEVGGGLAVLTEENSFTEGVTKLVKKYADDLIVYSEDFQADETNFKALILKAKQYKTKAFYISAASPKTYQVFIKQLHELKMYGKVYSYFQPGDADSIKNLGSLQEGVAFIDVPTIKTAPPDYAEFFEEFTKMYPDGPAIDILLRSSYDAIMTIVKSIEGVGDDALKVRDYMSQNSFQGALGKIKFDKNGDVRDLDFVIARIQQGKKALVR